jgi:hypothetical protein
VTLTADSTAFIRTVDQLKRDYLLAWELEHGQTRVGPQINPADLLIPEPRCRNRARRPDWKRGTRCGESSWSSRLGEMMPRRRRQVSGSTR